jgi:hypothetical protein
VVGDWRTPKKNPAGGGLRVVERDSQFNSAIIAAPAVLQLIDGGDNLTP